MPIKLILGVVVIFIFISVIALLLRKVGSGRSPKIESAYEIRPFLSDAERSFFGVLQQAVASDHQVFAKVRVADILRPIQGLDRGQRQRDFNRISAKHIDFIICDPKELRVLGVIELDDKSHSQSNRQSRDNFLDAAFASASIPILRIPARQSYSPGQLREQILKWRVK